MSPRASVVKLSRALNRCTSLNCRLCSPTPSVKCSFTRVSSTVRSSVLSTTRITRARPIKKQFRAIVSRQPSRARVYVHTDAGLIVGVHRCRCIDSEMETAIGAHALTFPRHKARVIMVASCTDSMKLCSILSLHPWPLIGATSVYAQTARQGDKLRVAFTPSHCWPSLPTTTDHIS